MQPRGDSAISVLCRLISYRLLAVAMASLAKASCGFAARMDGRIASEYFASLIRGGEDRTVHELEGSEERVTKLRGRQTQNELRSLFPVK
jgi:hypothetical protein